MQLNLIHSIKKYYEVAKRPKLAFNFFYLKILQKFSSFYARKISPKAIFKPTQLDIRVTDRCFLNCKMCGQRGTIGRFTTENYTESEILPENLIKIADEAGKWFFKPLIKITGGEPLIMGEKLFDAITHMKNKGLCVRMSTNGVLLNKMNMAEKLVESGIDVIGFSIDGPKDTHNNIRGFDYVFDMATNGIKNVLEARKKSKKNPLVMISCTLSKLNDSEILKLTAVARKLKVDWLNFQFFNFTNKVQSVKSNKVVEKLYGISDTPWKNFGNMDIANVDVDKIYNAIKTIKAQKFTYPISFMNIGKLTKKNIKNYYYNLDDPINANMCHQPFSTAFIVPPGNIVFCTDYPFYFLDDIDGNGLEKTWFSDKATKFRTEFVKYYNKEGKNFPHCQRCNWRFNY